MFDELNKAMKARMAILFKEPTSLFRVSIDPELLWSTYLEGMPEETRQTYNCNSCRQFVKRYGGLVSINNTTWETRSLWAVETKDYGALTTTLDNLVRAAPIKEPFLTDTKKLGTESSYDGVLSKRWHHLSYTLSDHPLVKADAIPTELSKLVSATRVFLRALDEIPQSVVATVLELIESDSIYRGAEKLRLVKDFSKCLDEYQAIAEPLRLNYAWYTARRKPHVTHFRNDVIGTLLVDIAEGKDLSAAVQLYESKVAPANYQRTTALATPMMKEKAKETIQELGLMGSLRRSFASIGDIDLDNVFYLVRDKARVVEEGDILAEIGFTKDKPVKPQSFDRAKEISLQDFLKTVVPGATRIEVLLEPNKTPNLVSLIKADDPTSPGLFKWSNHFSWCYIDATADSDMKKRVKREGGKVEGILRCSLMWHNYDDLDIHLKEPGGTLIYFSHKRSRAGGALDVDMNAGGSLSLQPVENIIYPYNSGIEEGTYTLSVDRFSARSNSDQGYEVEIECMDQVFSFSFDTNVSSKVASFTFSKKNGVKITSGNASLSGAAGKEVWGLQTNTFQPVTAIMHSPNYWHEGGLGNKHTFFFLEGCVNPGEGTRGFFNEFLRPELSEHRKSFELIGGSLSVAPSTDQLSGLGFSSRGGELIVRVSGATTRVLKVKLEGVNEY